MSPQKIVGALLAVVIVCFAVVTVRQSRDDDRVASASAPAPIGFVRQYVVTQNYIEQQSPDYYSGVRLFPETWVKNPWSGTTRECGWDVDDAHADVASGTLPAGEKIATSYCIVGDGFNSFGGDNHRVEAYVLGEAGLTVRLTSDRGYSETAVFSGGSYLICHVENMPGPYPVVDGSNGGTGLRETYTLTVENPTSRKSRGVWAMLQTGFNTIYAVPCQHG